MNMMMSLFWVGPSLFSFFPFPKIATRQEGADENDGIFGTIGIARRSERCHAEPIRYKHLRRENFPEGI